MSSVLKSESLLKFPLDPVDYLMSSQRNSQRDSQILREQPFLISLFADGSSTTRIKESMT